MTIQRLDYLQGGKTQNYKDTELNHIMLHLSNAKGHEIEVRATKMNSLIQEASTENLEHRNQLIKIITKYITYQLQKKIEPNK